MEQAKALAVMAVLFLGMGVTAMAPTVTAFPTCWDPVVGFIGGNIITEQSWFIVGHLNGPNAKETYWHGWDAGKTWAAAVEGPLGTPVGGFQLRLLDQNCQTVTSGKAIQYTTPSDDVYGVVVEAGSFGGDYVIEWVCVAACDVIEP